MSYSLENRLFKGSHIEDSMICIASNLGHDTTILFMIQHVQKECVFACNVPSFFCLLPAKRGA